MAACGECRFFRVHTQTAEGRVGDCRHQPQRGDFGPEAPICGAFLSISAPIPIAMPEQASRRARTLHGPVDPVLRRHPVAPAEAARPATPVSFAAEVDLGEVPDMTLNDLRNLLREALEETPVQLAPKWEGGSVILKPRDPSLQPRELPIDQLLHKVVMVRDRLRVLEQKINAHEKLSDAEKVDMQQYVTRCYGSLTTFNQLFRDKSDHFTGEKGEA